MLRHRWLDWGLDHPTVCLWADIYKEQRFVYVWKEHYKQGLLVGENAQVIKQITGDLLIDKNVIDPSAGRRDPVTGGTISHEFARHGIYCVLGDRRERGYDITKMFFKKNMIKIHPSCKNLILQLKNLQWGDKTGDDCTDALRYGLTEVHDTVFGGNLLDVVKRVPTVYTEDYLKKRREINVNDPNMFPARPVESQSWILEEIEA